MKIKILIIGAAGQVGGAFFDVFKRNKDFSVFGADKISSSKILYLDITKKQDIEKLFKKISPDIVILPAAFSNVDACEDKKNFTRQVNVKGVENVVVAAKKRLAKIIYFSTAYIFDGRIGNYRENDNPNPINFYAKTKLKAEKIIQRELNDYLIIRTNWVFDLGYDQKNFVVRLLASLKRNESVKVPCDQYGNPTLARNIAWVAEELIQKNKKGIYHIVGREKMNKYQWAKRAAEYFKLNSKLIIPVSTRSLKQRAARPRKSDLNIQKSKKELKTKLFSLKEELELFKKNEQ